MKSKVKINLIYNTIYHVFLIVVPLITTPYVSRRLGAAGIGDYEYAYSVANYFALFIKLGLNNYGNRTIAYTRDDRARMSREFWGIYAFQFIMVVVVLALYIPYCFLISDNRQISLYFILFVVSSGIDITWFYWGMEEFKITVTRSFLIKILSTLGIFVFVKTPDDTWKYTLILCVGTLGGQVFLWRNLRKRVDFVKPTRNEVVKHIKPNLVLFLPAVAVSLYKIMDKIMLGMMSSKVEVGYYGSSEKVIQVPKAFIESLGAVMQPRMSNLVANHADEKQMDDILKKSVISILLCVSIVCFGIMTVADDFVPLFYGDGFETCAKLFKILMPSCLFLAFTNLFKTQYLLPHKLDKEYTIALFTGAVVNLAVNALLIPRLAAVGAAWGTLLAEASVLVVIVLVSREGLNAVRYIAYTVPFIVAGLVMYLIGRDILFCSNYVLVSLVAKIAISGLVYVMSLGAELVILKYAFKNDYLNDIVLCIKGMVKRQR